MALSLLLLIDLPLFSARFIDIHSPTVWPWAAKWSRDRMVHPIPSKALGAQTVFQPQSLCPNGTICSYCVPNLAAYTVAEHAQAKRIISGLDPRGPIFATHFVYMRKAFNLQLLNLSGRPITTSATSQSPSLSHPQFLCSKRSQLFWGSTLSVIQDGFRRRSRRYLVWELSEVHYSTIQKFVTRAMSVRLAESEARAVAGSPVRWMGITKLKKLKICNKIKCFKITFERTDWRWIADIERYLGIAFQIYGAA